ncbi:MAG: hypothetical protein AAFY82_00235 [Pseudomonadota bacterium]
MSDLLSTGPMNAEEVARICFGMKADWLYRARKSLEETGFPPPINMPPARRSKYKDGTERGRLMWSREAIIAWKRQQVPNELRPNVGLPMAAANDAIESIEDEGRAQAERKIETRFL